MIPKLLYMYLTLDIQGLKIIIHSKNHQYQARRKEIIGYPKKKFITRTIPKKEYRRGYPWQIEKIQQDTCRIWVRNKLRKYRKYQTQYQD